MPTKEQYADHSWMLEQLKNAQDADHDNRERAREAHNFVDKRDGQWEQKWYDANDGKPRYTFDLTNPIIDQVAGDMERSDFDIRITPAGGDSTKEVAKTLDGMVRNIENISGATSIYNRAGREMITCGFDAWRVVQKYVDDNSFDQDLVIEKIGNQPVNSAAQVVEKLSALKSGQTVPLLIRRQERTTYIPLQPKD